MTSETWTFEASDWTQADVDNAIREVLSHQWGSPMTHGNRVMRRYGVSLRLGDIGWVLKRLCAEGHAEMRLTGGANGKRYREYRAAK